MNIAIFMLILIAVIFAAVMFGFDSNQDTDYNDTEE